jgi:hypothetical protein
MLQMVQQIGKLAQFLQGDFNGAASSSTRLRKLIPEIREYAPQLRDFGTVFLTEKNLSRGLNWATERLRGSDNLSALR